MLSLNSLALQLPKQEVTLAAGPGIEPGLWDSKSRVLPLHHPATLTILSRTHLENKSDSPFTSLKYAVAWCCAEVAELADAADSKSAEVNSRVGSSPTFGTTLTYKAHAMSEIKRLCAKAPSDSRNI